MKRREGFGYLSLSLLAFMGLGIEVPYAFLIEPVLYKAPIRGWTTVQYIIHWVITCVTWGLIAFALIRISKVKLGFDLFASGGKVRIWRWVCAAGLVLFSLGMSYAEWNGFKIAKEFQNNGLLKFVFQHIYYAFEIALVVLILVFAQKGSEILFRKENIPYGGIFLAATWGLAHTFTKGSTRVGLVMASASIMYGLVYLLLNRDIRKVFFILYIMFVV